MLVSILVSLIVLMVLVAYMYTRHNNQPGIVEYRNFSCRGWNDFTFQYPVFKGLESVRMTARDDTTCVMRIGETDTYGLIDVSIYRGGLSSMRSDDYKKTFGTKMKINMYYRLEEANSTADSSVNNGGKLEIFYDASDPNLPKGVIIKSTYLTKNGQVKSFDQEKFLKTILNSFTLVRK